MNFLFLVLSLCLITYAQAQSKVENITCFEEAKLFVKAYRPSFNFANVNDLHIDGLDRIVGQHQYANHIATKYGIDSNYYIRDFNQDGMKDLLIYGYEKGLNIFVLLSNGKRYNSYNLHESLSGVNAIFPKINRESNLIEIYEIESIAHDKIKNQEKPIKHILIFQDSAFVEYNPNPKEYSIDSIIVSMQCPWWNNSKYSFRIDDKSIVGWVRNIPEKITLPYLSNQQWNNIKKRLNYADFPSISIPNYMIMDNITYITTIYFNNGLSHTIKDNHGYTNRSLQLIYRDIMSLKNMLDEILTARNKPRLPGLQ